MQTAAYLDALKRQMSIESDYALAKALGVTRYTVSGWRAGRHFPDALLCYRMAEALSIEPALVVADIERERAERAGKDAQASAWREWVEKLGGVAASLLLGAVLICPAESRASNGAGLQPVADPDIHCRC